MDLSKIVKAELENIIYDILNDLEEHDSQLYDKYTEMIDDILYAIDDTEAVEIVRGFKPYGEAFSMAKVKEILNKMHVSEEQCLDYYLCMNMTYNDYKAYPEMKRLDVQDFCFEMSRLFINDSDGPKHKVSKFFKMFLDDEKNTEN